MDLLHSPLHTTIAPKNPPISTASKALASQPASSIASSSNQSHHPASHYFQMAVEELPFYPREKLIEKQKYFQSISKHTYLKGPFDKITSVVIPFAFAGASCFLIARGIYNMSHGIGKKE